MLKQRYFYPTNLFIAKYDTILRDFSCVCQIKCLKCKLLHFIFKLLEERRKFKLECAFFFFLCCILFTRVWVHQQTRDSVLMGPWEKH